MVPVDSIKLEGEDAVERFQNWKENPKEYTPGKYISLDGTRRVIFGHLYTYMTTHEEVKAFVKFCMGCQQLCKQGGKGVRLKTDALAS